MMRLLGRAGSRRACGGLGPDRPAPGPGSTSSPDGRLGLSGLPVGEIPVNAAPAPAERATDPAVPSNRSCTTLQSREQRIQRRYCLRLSITLCNWLRRGAVGWPPSGRGRRCVSSTAWCSRRHGLTGPYGEAAMRGGGRRAERRRQVPPGTAAGQRVHHCREHGPLVTRSGPTTLRTSSEGRQQRGGQLPEFIRNQTLR